MNVDRSAIIPKRPASQQFSMQPQQKRFNSNLNYADEEEDNEQIEDEEETTEITENCDDNILRKFFI